MAFQDLINYGVNTQDRRFAGLGEAAKQGFLDGEKRMQDAKEREFVESERNRIADEREQKELDAFYGDLYVPPTGSKSYDAGVELMGREWKAEYAALNAAKKAGQIDNQMYVEGKHEIRNRAQTLKQGQQALNTGFQTFKKAEEEGMISASTPAKSRLFYQALEDGTAEITNVDGRPTLIGQTADGEEISIDMAALASGNAGIKFNQKVDTAGLTNTIAQTLEGYKTTVATENGISLGNVGWEQIQERAAHDIDQALNNVSTVQAIAADELGYNHEQINALGEEELQNRVGDYLLDKVQQEYFPTDKFSTYKQNKPPAAPGGGGGGEVSATQLKINEQKALAQKVEDVIATGKLEDLSGLNGYVIERDNDFFGSGYSYEIVDPKGEKHDLTPEQAAGFLRNAITGSPAAAQQSNADRIAAIKARIKKG